MIFSTMQTYVEVYTEKQLIIIICRWLFIQETVCLCFVELANSWPLHNYMYTSLLYVSRNFCADVLDSLYTYHRYNTTDLFLFM